MIFLKKKTISPEGLCNMNAKTIIKKSKKIKKMEAEDLLKIDSSELEKSEIIVKNFLNKIPKKDWPFITTMIGSCAAFDALKYLFKVNDPKILAPAALIGLASYITMTGKSILRIYFSAKSNHISYIKFTANIARLEKTILDKCSKEQASLTL